MNRFPSSFVRSSINISLPSAWIHNYVAAGIASVTKVGCHPLPEGVSRTKNWLNLAFD
jgi:hypothetical protein